MKKYNISSATHSQAGFTILELMIAVAIGAILVVVAIPSFEETVRRNRIDGEAQKIYGLLKQARMSAMTTNSPSFVCRSRANSDPLVCNTPSGGRNWRAELKLYTALTNTTIPAPNSRYENQRLDELENDNDKLEEMLQKSLEAPNNNLRVRASNTDAVIRFNADGTLSNITPFRIAVCDNTAGSEDRYGQLIEINQSGQLRLTRVSLTDNNRDCTPRAR